MMKIKQNKFSLLDKKRFEVPEKEKKEYLRKLNVEKSIEILEALTSRDFIRYAGLRIHSFAAFFENRIKNTQKWNHCLKYLKK